LLNQYKAIEKMVERNKDMIKTLIDAFISKGKLKTAYTLKLTRPFWPGFVVCSHGQRRFLFSLIEPITRTS